MTIQQKGRDRQTTGHIPSIVWIEISEFLKLTVIRMITFFFKLIFRDECFQVTFESSLAMIGGTMGLLTGFSILSGVEIIFFLIKILIKGFRDGKEMLATGNKK